ncbi:NUDIX domain-containing protein [Haladaptatus sp. YSMS36]|uniref:NUDIX domain-containing protein n=1 Tax=Haladaptatus sp. YSMS36 TaxID=3033384 RepID=UPI0023E784AE|nr:NUDIX domain-containing protein [Haladaptatus sp. YSMS36]
MNPGWIPADEWRTIVANVPIVSVDLLVRKDERLVFGKRTNQPAKGYWFVPGGRVHKGETREEAVHRVGEQELGLEVTIIESLGAYEHLYETADVENAGGKHYLANGYVVEVVDGKLRKDDQHADLKYYDCPPEPLHEYVAQYLSDAESLPREF